MGLTARGALAGRSRRAANASRAGVASGLAPALALALALAAPGAAGDVWKRVDARGVTHFSDRPMGPGSVLVVRSKRRPAAARTLARLKQIQPAMGSVFSGDSADNAMTTTESADRTCP